MKRYLLTCWCAGIALLAMGEGERRVAFEQVVANADTTITLPVMLSETQGIAAVSFSVNYNPEVLILKSVAQGSLADLFSFDFTTLTSSGAVDISAVAPENITVSRKGSVALLTFYVRAGTEALYSDLSLAEVLLKEETMTVDLNSETQGVPVSGLVKPFRVTGACTERISEGAVTIAENTTLETLHLGAEDQLALSADRLSPITVTKTLTHCADAQAGTQPIQLRAPLYGWASGTYPIIKVPAETAPMIFEVDGLPEGSVYTQTTVDGFTTYSLDVNVPGEIDVALSEEVEVEEGEGLNDYDKVILRSHIQKKYGNTYSSLKVKGKLEDIQLGIDLGISPKITLPVVMRSIENLSTATATYETPKLTVIGFNPKDGSVKIKVVPPEGASIVDTVVTGVLHVYGTDSLDKPMTEIENISINLEGYLNAETLGEVEFAITLGTKTFIKVTAGR